MDRLGFPGSSPGDHLGSVLKWPSLFVIRDSLEKPFDFKPSVSLVHLTP